MLLLFHTANAVRTVLEICDQLAIDFDFKLNSSKSVAMRIGERCSVQCPAFVSKFVNEMKYLHDGGQML